MEQETEVPTREIRLKPGVKFKEPSRRRIIGGPLEANNHTGRHMPRNPPIENRGALQLRIRITDPQETQYGIIRTRLGLKQAILAERMFQSLN